jgi:ABC-type enterobactin transport system permease subunit
MSSTSHRPLTGFAALAIGFSPTLIRLTLAGVIFKSMLESPITRPPVIGRAAPAMPARGE